MGKYDSSELLEASRKGDYNTVEKILNHHKSKKSAFHSLRRGVGVNTQDNSGYNALHHASLNGHTDVVQLLLSHDDINPILVDTRGSSPLHLAAWAGHADICKLLLTHPHLPADPNAVNAENETPLHFAAQHGHLTALIELLAQGADPNIMNCRDETPLDLGAQYGRLQVVQILIRSHNELLLPLKATSTPINHTAIHLASRNGHRDIVDMLLAAGCNVNILTPNGSALHEAALCGKESVVKTLLREGIDMDLTDCDGRTVFHLLDEFPANVVNRIRNVINNHRQSSIYDSESDELQENFGRYQRRGHSSSFSGYQPGSSSNSGHAGSRYHQQKPQHAHRYQEQYETYGGTTSPSSSMGSFGGGPSPTPSPAGVLVAIKPKSAPMKPPRKSHSISPPNHPQSLNLMSQSLDLDYGMHHSSNDQLDCSSSASSNHQQKSQKQSSKSSKDKQRGPYEFLYLSHSGESEDQQQTKPKKTPDVEKPNENDYIIMNTPITIPTNYDDKIVRVANPHRKLRRSKDGFPTGPADKNDTDTFVQIRRNPNDAPLSPTHYPAAPTPEHAPPSAREAENYIHERIRPLSQEYKRCSGKLDLNKSPASASSGSLSSVSLSSSTDCVEEYHGDAPFAGLFKGSTMTLNNQNTFQTHLTTFSQSNQKQDEVSRVQIATTANNNNNNNNNNGSNLERSVNLMSPFDEQEEWAKISEIMESFGSGIARESVFVNDIENEFKQRLGLKNSEANGSKLESPIVEEEVLPLRKWLADIKMEHLEEHLMDNGYDNPDYINGIITNENDLEVCGIPAKDRQSMLAEISKLPKPPTLMEANKNNKLNNNQHPVPTVDQWLTSIQLEDYIDVFKRHLYMSMEKIYRVWEIELQAVLEINKIGHRKRILYSLIGQRIEPPNIDEINENACSTADLDLADMSSDNNNPSPPRPAPAVKPVTLSRHKKSRPAPQPPTQTNKLEIRAPSELLLTNQGSLQAQWKHSAAALVSGSIKYEVFYLGSTIIKELRGTESTRKSIQKLKKGDRVISSSSPSHSSLIQAAKRPVCLAISHNGVLFIDIESQGTICEHNIKNIDCACQDAEDLSHFAYITKDFENNTNYCHVFNVETMELATEIILTLGQAFEVAYQLALREASTTPSSAGKRPMSLASTTSTSDHG